MRIDFVRHVVAVVTPCHAPCPPSSPTGPERARPLRPRHLPGRGCGDAGAPDAAARLADAGRVLGPQRRLGARTLATADPSQDARRAGDALRLVGPHRPNVLGVLGRVVVDRVDARRRLADGPHLGAPAR